MTGANTSTSFLFAGGVSYDLNALLPANSGWQISHAAGINNSGQIVGVGYDMGGGLRSFSMKPQAAAASLRRSRTAFFKRGGIAALRRVVSASA